MGNLVRNGVDYTDGFGKLIRNGINYSGGIAESNVKIQEGTFTTASTTHGTVEVPLDFDADYILVTLPFSETNLTYAIYDKNRMVMPGKKTYWLIPSENHIYEIGMVETTPTGETGITWKTANSFTFHSNASNAQNVECTFVAVKYLSM